MPVPKSGLQKEVLAFYRRALRVPLSKPALARAKFALFIRYTFRTTASTVSSKDIAAIEHLLRKGHRQLDVLQSPAVRDIGLSEEMKEWEKRHKLRMERWSDA